MAENNHNPFYDTKEWQKTRKIKLTADPLCERCKRIPAAHVHHVKPYKEYPELGLRLDNLQSLCRNCHDDMTIEEHKRQRRARPYDFGRSKRKDIRLWVMKGRK